MPPESPNIGANLPEATVVEKPKSGKKKTFAVLGAITLFVLIFICLRLLHSLGGSDISGFRTKDFSEAPGQDWKAYINQPFDLSLRYPPTMVLKESSDAFGFNDVFAVDLESTTSDGMYLSISIYSTTDPKKCGDLMANTDLPTSFFNSKKMIAGKEFSVGAVSEPLGYAMSGEVFGYLQTAPICKVANVFAGQAPTGSSASKTSEQRKQADFTPILQTIESVIGSMDTDVQPTANPSDTIYMNGSDSAISNDVTRINSARLAASRVYNYNSDNIPKSIKSYVGTCEDAAFKITSADMTCRESANSFIMYYKIPVRIAALNNQYGYACGDANWSGLVNVEPTGLDCRKGAVSSASNTALTTSQISSYKGQLDCGSQTYSDFQTESNALVHSTCFNTRFKMCAPATVTGIVGDKINTNEIIGQQGNQCKVTLVSASTQSPGGAAWTCLFDPSQPFSMSNDAIEKYCTVSQ